MSNRYSKTSSGRLLTCHYDLIELFEDVISVVDNSILCGWRSEEDQMAAFNSGRSEAKWPDSAHNHMSVNKPESLGIDVAPYPIPERWGELSEIPTRDEIKTLHRFYHFAGVVIGIASLRGIKIRWGGDWDGDHEFTDQTFDDLVHFELIRG